MISKQTAMDIALAYREVETAEKLLADIEKTMSPGAEAVIRDVFGRLQHSLELGMPNGAGAHRLFNVPFSLARPVIQAHIAHHKAQIAALNIKAQEEANTLEQAEA